MLLVLTAEGRGEGGVEGRRQERWRGGDRRGGREGRGEGRGGKSECGVVSCVGVREEVGWNLDSLDIISNCTHVRTHTHTHTHTHYVP